MVATRRGVRVCSPTKTNSDESSGVMTTRRTRRTADKEETATQSEVTSDSQQDVPSKAQSSTVKRKTRASKRETGSANQVDSTHEADVSESESCCSAISDMEAIPDTQPARRGRRRAAGGEQSDSTKEEAVSEVDSCSLSASRRPNTRRATRSLRKAVLTDSAKMDNDVSEAESCSSVVSDSKVPDSQTRVTRRTAVSSSRASLKSHTEDTELSDPESCASGISGAQTSTVHRVTRCRSGRFVEAIPMHLEETTDGSISPLPRRRSRVVCKGYPCDPQSPQDSESFESGPSITPRRSTRRRTEPKQTGTTVTDSESDLPDVNTPLGSPRSVRGRGTPCSSRTGSNSSSRAAPVTRLTAKALDILVEKAQCQSDKVSVSEVAEESEVLEDNKLDDTVYADPDCSMIEEVAEEDKTLTLEDVVIAEPAAPIQDAAPAREHTGSVTVSEDAEMPEVTSVQQESAETTVSEDPEKNTSVVDIPAQENILQEKLIPADSEVKVTLCESADTEMAEAVCELAVEAEDQQRELSTEDAADTDVPVITEQETIMPADSQVSLEKTVKVAACENAVSPVIVVSDEDEEEKAMDVDVNTHTNPPSEVENQECKAVPSEEGMDVSSTLVTENKKADQDKSPHTTEPIKVTSSQNLKVSVSDADKLGEPRDCVIVQKSGVISLLESSEDEEDDDNSQHSEEADERKRQGSDGEEEAVCIEEEAGPSRPQAAAQSSADDGLFVIDTRPGLQSGQQYYVDDKEKEGGDTEAEEEQDEEEFVDEEGDDDDDDEDEQVLFTSRNPQLKELSSRIDPGLKVKELGGLYINFDGSKSKTVSNSLKEQKSQDELMKKSVIGPEFEKRDAVPPYRESKQAAKLKRKEERDKTTGAGWFNMRAPEMTEELKGDLKALKMRGAMDPKRFYKKNDRDGFPKYFQVATVVDSPVDFYHSRVPKKDRKRTMVEELLADAEFRHNNKKKYQQIMTEKAAIGAGKKNRKNNKFRK
ncbi:deoxynucleotidyltransferase terminal-interacting protein 2 [Coregonus clupeaformis]|uniref:deoxynucleotidyltransferase terminal-interacting protein 2 n=1 Tax=Coregonus clupeaformis TaxID=59861 RepID=UPI001BDFAB93|nr:deoxynucleotidyltransferase terminal-interacting protein 2 [Coregonus clupeaformis]